MFSASQLWGNVRCKTAGAITDLSHVFTFSVIIDVLGAKAPYVVREWGLGFI